MTEYVPVSWSKEPITVEKLHTMSANDQALFEMKPAAAFKHNGVTRSRGVKVLAGSKLMQPSKEWNDTKEVLFGNFFSAGCNPVVIATHYGYPQTGMNVAVKGLGNTKIPDHRGFVSYAWTDDRNGNKGRIVQPYYVAYIAIGW